MIVQLNSFFSFRIENLTHLMVELVHPFGSKEVVNHEQFDKFKCELWKQIIFIFIAYEKTRKRKRPDRHVYVGICRC